MKNVHPKNIESKTLVEMWTDFIDWKKRRLGEGGFIIKTLKHFGCKKIFDACLGDGSDSIHLNILCNCGLKAAELL